MITALLLIAATAQCAVPESEGSRQMALPYEKFDSESGPGGWRTLNGKGCTDEAVRLLQDYSAANRNRLSAADLSELAFHQGQALAFNGREAEAVPHFRESLRIGGDDEWTTYVTATIAFLNHDGAGLLRARERYAAISPGSMRLKVLDGFLKCSGESYMKAVHCAM